MELWDDRKYESYDGSDDEKWYPDDTQIVGIVSSITSTEEVDDELHIDLRENRSNIGCEHDPESVFDDLLDEILVVYNVCVSQIGYVVWTIHEYRSEEYPDCHAAYPGPCIGYEGPHVEQIEPECKEYHEYHSEELGSLLEFGVLTHSKDSCVHVMYIHPKEKYTKDLKDWDCFRRTKIVFREISWWEKQCETYEGTGDELCDERVDEQRLESSPVFLYDELGEEKVQTLSQSKIVVGSQKPHETEYPVEKSDFFDTQVIGENYLDYVSEWSDQKREEIEPEAFTDEFFCEWFALVEHFGKLQIIVYFVGYSIHLKVKNIL